MEKEVDGRQLRESMNELGKRRIPFLFVVDFKAERGFVLERPDQQTDILFQTPIGGNKPDEVLPAAACHISPSPLSFDTYKDRFDLVMNGLRRGDSYLTNLTVRTPVRTDLSLRDIFMRSQSPYSLLVPNSFVCFSPERFVSLSEGVIATHPMKGTIRADIPGAEQLILSDPKETAEHCTVVDLLRNDIGRVADEVEVNRFRYVERIAMTEGEILQVSSEIRGKLSGNYHERLGDILFNLLPAGSVSGAPKDSTIALIERAEPEPRNYYTGVFGYYNGEQLDSGVLIRFIARQADQLYFHSGGGITVNSRAEDEYDEVLRKIYLPFT